MKTSTVTYEEYETALENGFDVPHLLHLGESAYYTNGIWVIVDPNGDEYIATATASGELGSLLLYIECLWVVDE